MMETMMERRGAIIRNPGPGGPRSNLGANSGGKLRAAIEIDPSRHKKGSVWLLREILL